MFLVNTAMGLRESVQWELLLHVRFLMTKWEIYGYQTFLQFGLAALGISIQICAIFLFPAKSVRNLASAVVVVLCTTNL